MYSVHIVAGWKADGTVVPVYFGRDGQAAAKAVSDARESGEYSHLRKYFGLPGNPQGHVPMKAKPAAVGAETGLEAVTGQASASDSTEGENESTEATSTTPKAQSKAKSRNKKK